MKSKKKMAGGVLFFFFFINIIIGNSINAFIPINDSTPNSSYPSSEEIFAIQQRDFVYYQNNSYTANNTRVYNMTDVINEIRFGTPGQNITLFTKLEIGASFMFEWTDSLHTDTVPPVRHKLVRTTTQIREYEYDPDSVGAGADGWEFQAGCSWDFDVSCELNNITLRYPPAPLAGYQFEYSINNTDPRYYVFPDYFNERYNFYVWIDANSTDSYISTYSVGDNNTQLMEECQILQNFEFQDFNITGLPFSDSDIWQYKANISAYNDENLDYTQNLYNQEFINISYANNTDVYHTNISHYDVCNRTYVSEILEGSNDYSQPNTSYYFVQGDRPLTWNMTQNLCGVNGALNHTRNSAETSPYYVLNQSYNVLSDDNAIFVVFGIYIPDEYYTALTPDEHYRVYLRDLVGGTAAYFAFADHGARYGVNIRTVYGGSSQVNYNYWEFETDKWQYFGITIKNDDGTGDSEVIYRNFQTGDTKDHNIGYELSTTSNFTLHLNDNGQIAAGVERSVFIHGLTMFDYFEEEPIGYYGLIGGRQNQHVMVYNGSMTCPVDISNIDEIDIQMNYTTTVTNPTYSLPYYVTSPFYRIYNHSSGMWEKVNNTSGISNDTVINLGTGEFENYFDGSNEMLIQVFAPPWAELDGEKFGDCNITINWLNITYTKGYIHYPFDFSNTTEWYYKGDVNNPILYDNTTLSEFGYNYTSEEQISDFRFFVNCSTNDLNITINEKYQFTIGSNNDAWNLQTNESYTWITGTEDYSDLFNYVHIGFQRKGDTYYLEVYEGWKEVNISIDSMEYITSIRFNKLVATDTIEFKIDNPRNIQKVDFLHYTENFSIFVNYQSFLNIPIVVNGSVIVYFYEQDIDYTLPSISERYLGTQNLTCENGYYQDNIYFDENLYPNKWLEIRFVLYNDSRISFYDNYGGYNTSYLEVIQRDDIDVYDSETIYIRGFTNENSKSSSITITKYENRLEVSYSGNLTYFKLEISVIYKSELSTTYYFSNNTISITHPNEPIFLFNYTNTLGDYKHVNTSTYINWGYYCEGYSSSLVNSTCEFGYVISVSGNYYSPNCVLVFKTETNDEVEEEEEEETFDDLVDNFSLGGWNLILVFGIIIVIIIIFRRRRR